MSQLTLSCGDQGSSGELCVEKNSQTNPKNTQIIENDFPITIQNIIASAYLGLPLDLREITVSIRDAEYNPRKVNAVVFRLRRPRCTTLIFSTGKLMITGAAGEKEAKYGAKRVAKLLSITFPNWNISFSRFQVENLIAASSINQPIRLESLAADHKDYCSYEPELFSGKIIVTGCKTQAEARYVVSAIMPVLLQYSE